MLKHLFFFARHKNFIWYLFVALILFEYFLFRMYILRNVTGFYPVNYDQTDYLLLSYRIFENIKAHGFILGIIHSDVLFNGIFFPIQAAVFYVLFGVSRLSALLPNFFYFSVLQFFCLIVVRFISNKNSTALIFLGILLCLQTPFLHVGGLTDFRMDFIAFCNYGIFICTVIRANIFLSRPWSFLAGIIVCLTISLRFITAVYLIPIIGFMFIYFLLSLRKKNLCFLEISQTKKRLTHLFLISIPMTIMVIPYVWVNRMGFWNYYVETHIITNEKYIRAHEVGVTTFLSSLLFYPHSVLVTHIGFLALNLAAFISIFCFLFLYKKNFNKKNKVMPWKESFIFLLLCIFIPLFILTIDISKSSVVGSIIALPCLWLFFLFYLYSENKIQATSSAILFFYFLAVMSFSLGFYNVFVRLHHHLNKEKRQDVTTITQMYQDIGDYALNKNWLEVRLSVDHIVDYLAAHAIAVVYYETRHKMIKVDPDALGRSIFSINKMQALDSLQTSNVLILNLNPYHGVTPYPFDQTVAELKPLLFKIAEKKFHSLGDYPFRNTIYRVYVKG